MVAEQQQIASFCSLFSIICLGLTAACLPLPASAVERAPVSGRNAKWSDADKVGISMT